MRRITLVMVIVGVTSILTLSAQESDSLIVKPLKKHEVSISLNPVFLVFYQSQDKTPLYLSYKYQLKKVKLRTSISLQTTNGLYNTFDGGIPSSTDTSFIQNFSVESKENNSIRFGIEHTKKTKFIDWVFGVDLLVGYESVFTEKLKVSYNSSENSDGFTYFIYGDSPNTIQDNYLNLGLSASVGINVKISERFSTGLLLPMDLYYSSLINSESAPKPSSRFNFSENLHLMLNFRF